MPCERTAWKCKSGMPCARTTHGRSTTAGAGTTNRLCYSATRRAQGLFSRCAVPCWSALPWPCDGCGAPCGEKSGGVRARRAGCGTRCPVRVLQPRRAANQATRLLPWLCPLGFAHQVQGRARPAHETRQSSRALCFRGMMATVLQLHPQLLHTDVLLASAAMLKDNFSLLI